MELRPRGEAPPLHRDPRVPGDRTTPACSRGPRSPPRHYRTTSADRSERPPPYTHAMSSRVTRRRSATAVWIYAAVACGILGTIVAARVLGLDEFGVFAAALAVVGFFQVLLDLTVEESLTKYGFRYVASDDWGRLRRLFRQALLLKVAGGALATLLIVAFAPFADEVFDSPGLEQALLAAALLPLVQSSENVGATALLLHSRYDLRA